MKSRNERSRPRDQHEILDMSDDAARAAEDLNRWMVGSGWAVAFRRSSEDYVVYEDAARPSGPTTSICYGIGVPSAEADDTTIDMKPQQEPSTQEVLAGLVERVTFHNDDNGGAWVAHLTAGSLVPLGFEAFSSPILDTFKFCQFLAKIAHCFAFDVLGDGFAPKLLDLITTEARSARYDLVGGMPSDTTPSDNLHELELNWHQFNGIDYALVKIRLFANLGAPTYVVVAGTAKAVCRQEATS
jgi:hypothetical protein